ncbi:hypothetical protein GCM10010232_11500 [Streptomyces amakusaensis]
MPPFRTFLRCGDVDNINAPSRASPNPFPRPREEPGARGDPTTEEGRKTTVAEGLPGLPPGRAADGSQSVANE